MTDTRLLSLLHFGDSAFPTGGYAHSFGLETYCQAGLVRGREDLARFLSLARGSAKL
jgi:urease accessory protein